MWKPTLRDFAAVIFTAWSLFGIMSPTCFADEGRIIRFKEQIPNKAFKGHMIRSENVPNEGRCRVLCYMEPSCLSINLGPLEGRTHSCELNDDTAEEQDFTHALTTMQGYTYLAMENPCASRPCVNGKCHAGFTEKGFRCLCLPGSSGATCSEVQNCADLYRAGEKQDGVYTIEPDNADAFEVFCDQLTSGGGWTVLQKRLNGSVDFYRGWNEYKQGFGNLNGEFWLGLDKIHRLTKEQSRLRVDLEDFNGNTAYAEYSLFGVASEGDKFKLSLGSYSGTAGDSLSIHSGMKFSTKDQDNDIWKHNCAVIYKGAWWYKACHLSNLNGRYFNGAHVSYANGVNWQSWKGYKYSVKRAEMKIKPINGNN